MKGVRGIGVFKINEQSKNKAYKELIQELEAEIKNKILQIEKLEIEYFKKCLLKDVYREEPEKEKNEKESKELIEKIKNERNSHKTLEDKINTLKANNEHKYGE